MTEQELMQMAKEAGFDSFFDQHDGSLCIRGNGYDDESVTDEIKRLMAMVAEREREACARECLANITPQMMAEGDWPPEAAEMVRHCVNDIRARNNKENQQ